MKRILIFSAVVLIYAGTANSQQPFRETLRAKADQSIPSYKLSNDLSGELVSIESERMDDLMKSWIAGFTKRYPNLSIKSLKRDTVGAMGVEPALTDGRIQLAPASRELMTFE